MSFSILILQQGGEENNKMPSGQNVSSARSKPGTITPSPLELIAEFSENYFVLLYTPNL